VHNLSTAPGDCPQENFSSTSANSISIKNIQQIFKEKFNLNTHFKIKNLKYQN
jgi:hypothetical protein